MGSVPERKVWLCDLAGGIKARILTLKDLPQIQALAEHSFTKRWSENDFRYFLTSEQGRCYGFFQENTLVAYLLSLIVQGDLDIVSIATDKSCLRKGYGKALIEMTGNMLDVKKVFLEVDVTNTVAVEFYQSLGFNQYGVRKNYYEGKRDAILFKKEKA